MLVRDFESSFLTLDPAEVSGFDDLLGHSITYRIARARNTPTKARTTTKSATANASCANYPNARRSSACNSSRPHNLCEKPHPRSFT